MNEQRLKQVLHYNPETGFFWWIHPVRGARKDRPAGSLDKKLSYVYITIDGVKYAAHRLAFLYMTGEWPIHTVDHWDGVRHNNVWTNIRDATHGQNLANRGLQKNNTSGYVGVTADRGLWKAVIKGKFLGRYSTPEEAYDVYKKAAMEAYGEFTHSSLSD